MNMACLTASAQKFCGMFVAFIIHLVVDMIVPISSFDTPFVLWRVRCQYLSGTTFNSLRTSVSSSIVCPRLAALFTMVVSFAVDGVDVSSSFCCNISNSDLRVLTLLVEACKDLYGNAIKAGKNIDSAYEMVSSIIISMLEVHDDYGVHEDAKFEVSRSLPSVWHVYEHELKGCLKFKLSKHCFSVHRSQGQYFETKKTEQMVIMKKRIVAIGRFKLKALGGNRQNEDIDWTRFDAEHMHFGQDGLDDFDWSNKADDAPVSLALMATNSEIRDLKLEEKQKELDQALKERDDFKVKLEKWSNASVLQNEVLNKQRYVSDKSCIGFGIESSNSMESDISSGDETLTVHI
ncbi:hypothetical protein Tco_0209618 [Tanacetum coccineum]